MLKKTVFIIMLAAALCILSQKYSFALYYYGGSGDGYGAAMGTTGDVVTIVSAADQTFAPGDAATAINAITIEMEVGQAGAGINITDDIRVRIPAAVDMVWYAADTTADVGGSASGRVSTTVSYEDLNKTMVIDVTADFVNGDYITVSGLSFTDFNSPNLSDNLDLEIDNLGTAIAGDSKCKIILGAYYGGSGDGYSFTEILEGASNAAFLGNNF